MSERKSQNRFSRGTAMEVFRRLEEEGESISYMGVCKRLSRENHLPTLKLAAEVELEKAIEAADIKNTLAVIGRVISKSKKYGTENC